MDRFEGLRDVDAEIVRLVVVRMDEFFKREEEEPIWTSLYNEERELKNLENSHPGLAFLVNASVTGLGAALQHDLEPEDWVWFRYSCLNSFLEVLGAIAETYRRGNGSVG